MLDKNQLCAIDNGNDVQKFAYWEGDKIVFGSSPSRGVIGAQSFDTDGNINGVYSVEGTNWTVGEDVLSTERIKGKSYATSEQNTALIHHSLVLSGFSGKDVKIMTGLPFSYYYENGKVNEEFINKVKESVKDKNVEARGNEVVANIIEQRIASESVAALFDYLLDENGDEVDHGMDDEFGLETAAVVDIGGGTTDITTVQIDGGSFKMIKDKSGTRECGVIDIREKLKDLITTEFEMDDMLDKQVIRALKTGKAKSFKGVQDVSALVSQAKKEESLKILNFVSSKIGDGKSLDLVLFVGGGAEVLKDEIRAAFECAVSPENPEYANASGMLKMLTFM